MSSSTRQGEGVEKTHAFALKYAIIKSIMKKLVIFSFSVLLLALSVFVVNAATFQGPPNGCTDPSGSNCNLEGVIWNRATTAPQAQDASFYIGGNTRTGGSARVGNGLQVDSGNANVAGEVIANFNNSANTAKLNNSGDLELKPGKAIRVDQNGTATTLNIANYGTGGWPVNVNIQGNLNINDSVQNPSPQICLDGACITSWPTGGGGGGGTVTSVGSGNGLTGGPITTSGNLNVGAGTGISVAADTVGLDTTYTDGRYVNVPGDTMTGNLNVPTLVASSNISSPVYYSGTFGVYPYSRIFYDEILLQDSNGRLDVASNSFKQISQTWDGNFPWSLDMRSLSNYNTTIGQVVFGAANNAGYFMRYIGGVSGNVGLVDTQGGITFGVNSNVPATDAYAGRFSGGSGLITLGGPTYTLDTAGTARFTGQLCLGGTCLSSWPSGGSGDITGVYAGAGLSGGSASGDATLALTACANGQLLKSTGAGWTCANDLDTNSGGDITAVTAGTGLAGGGVSGDVSLYVPTSFKLPQGCATDQIPKYYSPTGEWFCMGDNVGVNTITSGNGLTGIGTTGNVTVDIGDGSGYTPTANAITINTADGVTISGDYIALDTTYTDGRYVNHLGDDDMTGKLNLISNRSGTAGWIALEADGAEALWYDGTYFSWGFGATMNYFADRIHIGYTGDAGPTTYGALTLGDTAGLNIRMDGNEIMARNGGVSSILYLQQDGGAVYVNGVTAHASDRRLKKNITKLDYGIDEIMKLKPVTFEWKSDINNETNLGFIAQDVKPILPDTVKYDVDSDTYYLTYDDFIPVLVNAVQEQELKIQMLEKKIDAMENK